MDLRYFKWRYLFLIGAVISLLLTWTFRYDSQSTETSRFSVSAFETKVLCSTDPPIFRMLTVHPLGNGLYRLRGQELTRSTDYSAEEHLLNESGGDKLVYTDLDVVLGSIIPTNLVRPTEGEISFLSYLRWASARNHNFQFRYAWWETANVVYSFYAILGGVIAGILIPVSALLIVGGELPWETWEIKNIMNGPLSEIFYQLSWKKGGSSSSSIASDFTETAIRSIEVAHIHGGGFDGEPEHIETRPVQNCEVDPASAIDAPATEEKKYSGEFYPTRII